MVPQKPRWILALINFFLSPAAESVYSTSDMWGKGTLPGIVGGGGGGGRAVYSVDIPSGSCGQCRPIYEIYLLPI